MGVVQDNKRKTINASAVWIIWWPAIVLTVFSYYQYAHVFLLFPYARGLGLSHINQLSAGQFLNVFADTLFVTGILIPLSTFLASYFIGFKVTSRIVLLLSMLLASLNYASLVSVSATGSLVTWDLILDALGQAARDPELASHYISVSSVTNFALVLLSIVFCAVAVNQFVTWNMTPVWQNVAGCILLVMVGVMPSMYVFASMSRNADLDPGFDMVWQQIVVLFRLEPSRAADFDGLEFDQAISLFQKKVNAPNGARDATYGGAEKDSNLILISLETGPREVMDFRSIGRMENLRKLAKSSLVAEQHYSTYPYTSDALFSMLGSLYPNNLRRQVVSDASLELENNFDLHQIGLFHALNRSDYVVKVYMSNDSVIEADREMLYAFGAHDVFIPKEANVSEQQWRGIVESTIAHFSNYESMSSSDQKLFEKNLADDIASLDRLLADIRTMARAGKKFGALFLPRSGHGPWPNQEPDRSLLDTGKEIVVLQDRWIGEIIKTLEQEGVADSTVIAVTADHGLRTSAEYPGLKPGVLNEISFRVPLVVYAPNALTESFDVPHLTSHIDIAPTLLSLLGINDGSEYMLGSPVWDARIADRRTYFLANDYLGVDGYFEDNKFYMYHSMTDSTIVSDTMYMQRDSMEFVNSPLDMSEPDDSQMIKSNIYFQKSFQDSLKTYLLRPE